MLAKLSLIIKRVEIVKKILSKNKKLSNPNQVKDNKNGLLSYLK